MSRLRKWPQNEDDLKKEDDLKNEDDPKNEDHLKNEDILKNEDDLKNEGDIKNEHDLQNEDNLENWPSPPKQFSAPIPVKNYLDFFMMTSHLDSHTTTDVKSEMMPGV